MIGSEPNICDECEKPSYCLVFDVKGFDKVHICLFCNQSAVYRLRAVLYEELTANKRS